MVGQLVNGSLAIPALAGAQDGAVLALRFGVIFRVGQVDDQIALDVDVQGADVRQKPRHAAGLVERGMKLPIQLAPLQRVALIVHDGDQPL
jgi:hypothetical protein